MKRAPNVAARPAVLAALCAVGFLSLVLLPACQAMQDAAAVVVATHPARCADTGATAPAAEAFLGAADWQAHLGGVDAALRAALSGWQVDPAAGRSVALVRAGPQPNPGYRIQVEQKSLPVQAGTLRLRAVVQAPPRQRLQAQVIAYPCVYVQLEGASYRRVTLDVERRQPG